jgi:hypothetical protein
MHDPLALEPRNEPAPPHSGATRLEDLDDQERQAFRGLTNVVVFDTPELREARARIREVQSAMTAYMRQYARALVPALQQISRTV